MEIRKKNCRRACVYIHPENEWKERMKDVCEIKRWFGWQSLVREIRRIRMAIGHQLSSRLAGITSHWLIAPKGTLCNASVKSYTPQSDNWKKQRLKEYNHGLPQIGTVHFLIPQRPKWAYTLILFVYFFPSSVSRYRWCIASNADRSARLANTEVARQNWRLQLMEIKSRGAKWGWSIPHPYTLSPSFSLINTIRDLGGIVGSKWKGRRSVVEAFKNGHIRHQ